MLRLLSAAALNQFLQLIHQKSAPPLAAFPRVSLFDGGSLFVVLFPAVLPQ